MHLAIHSSRLVESNAARLLGAGHPLTCALAERASVRSQLWLVAALAAGSSGVHALRLYPAASVAMAAGFVCLVWCCRAALAAVAGGRDLGFGHGCTRPLLSLAVMRTVRRELEDVAAQVDGEAPNVAGLALLERLVRDGGSPLYGEDATSLRQELWRIRWRLCG